MVSLLLTLPVENPFRLLRLETVIQNFPLFGILGLFLFLYLFSRVTLGTFGKFFTVFLIYSNLIACIAWLLIGDVNLWSWMRGNVSLSLGLVTYFVLGYIFSEYRMEKIDKYIRTSYVVVLTVGFVQFATGAYRIYSTFTEPKHLGLFLVFVYLFWFEVMKNKYTLFRRIVLTASLILLLVGTFSTTAFLVLAVYLIISLFSKTSLRERLSKLVLVVVFIGLIVLLLNYRNYFSRMVLYTLNIGTDVENQSGTFIDSFSIFFFYGKINSLVSTSDVLSFLFGRGIGQEEFYFRLIGEHYFTKIARMKASTASYILSLAGKLQAYGGLLSLVLFIFANLRVSKILKRVDEQTLGQAAVAKKFLVLITICSLFTAGTFQNVMNWFVYAFVDYVLVKNVHLRIENSNLKTVLIRC